MLFGNMDKNQIIDCYRRSEDQKKQVEILADVNGCGKAEIVEFLKTKGYQTVMLGKHDLKLHEDMIRKHLNDGKPYSHLAKKFNTSNAVMKQKLAELGCDVKTRTKCQTKTKKLTNTQVESEELPEVNEVSVDNIGVELEAMVENDVVNHPSHYCTGKFECIDVMIETQGQEAVKNFCLCNAFKYLYRHNGKNGSEDIEKAIWYLKKYQELASK